MSYARRPRIAVVPFLIAGSLFGCSSAAGPPTTPPGPTTATVEPPVKWVRSGDELRWLRGLSNPTAAQWQRREALLDDRVVVEAADAYTAEAKLMGRK